MSVDVPGRGRRSTPTRMDAVQTPIIPVLGAMIRASPGTISLGQGVVHYGPPRAAVDAVVRALDSTTINEYHEGAGLPALVSRLAAKLSAENGIEVSRGVRVMVTAGANMAFMHAVLAITEPGDEIVLHAPFYFNHDMAVGMAGCTAVCVPTDAAYQPQLEVLRAAITGRTRAIVTVSPNNPTGAVYSEATLRAVNDLCREHGIYHLSDEAYEYFTYAPARHFSPGSLPGAEAHTVSFFSLSKAYGFAGWRIGYVAYPEHLASAMAKIQDTILICPTIVSQVAAIAALDVGRAWCEPHVQELAAIRDVVARRLSAMAPLVQVPAHDGAFYCLIKVATDADPMTLAERLICEHKVAVIPGSAFGMTEGCSFRVAYGALQMASVAEGIDRLVGGLRALA